MRLSKTVRAAVALVAVIDVLLFVRANPLALLAISVGAATVIFGLVFAYRPASIIGMLIVATSAGVSVEIPTLTDLGYIAMAGLGLFLPVLVLFWLCFSNEEEEGQIAVLRYVISASAYGIVCLLSVPVTVFALSMFRPGLAIGFAVMAEIAVVLLTATVLGIAFLWHGTRKTERLKAEARGEIE